ncbi:MAG: hypothetical protein EAZ97_11840 [Bacteroidetes bacterium]|nr:MAG: hypothetical protein EAZ97_11840 [Bacteroidota bacterium]
MLEILSQKHIQKFIRENLDSDTQRLLLNSPKFPDLPMREVVQQIESLRKIRLKISSWAEKNIICPPVLSVEQASSEQTAIFKTSFFSGNEFVDLTGGMGVDAYFFAQKFEKITYIEQNKALFETTKYNFEQLNLKNASFFCEKAEVFLQNLDHKVDLIYIDPARRDQNQQKTVQLSDCEPNILEILDLLLQKADQVLIKTSPLLDIALAQTQLRSLEKIIVISLENECKEVLYLLGQHTENQTVECYNLKKNQIQSFVFDLKKERELQIDFHFPEKYLYEANSSVLKAGAFKSIAKQFDLKKLHANSHLYTSRSLKLDFVGRIFEILHICKYDRKEILKFLPDSKANITVRNFPDSVAQIRQKTKIKDGGEHYLFATTDLQDRKMVLICKKL